MSGVLLLLRKSSQGYPKMSHPNRKKTQKRAKNSTQPTFIDGNHLSVVPNTKWTATSKFPIAPRLRSVLRYADTFTMTTGVPGLTTQVMNLNSLFDPDRTGTGHQPRGFDQLSTLYSRYRVYGVSFKVNCNLFTSTNDVLIIGVYPRNGTGTPANFSDSVENPWAVVDQYSLYVKPKTLKGFINLAELNGKTKTAYTADDTTQASTNASPTETMVMDITVESLSGANNTSYISVVMEFDCEFSDAVALAQS